MTTTLDFTLIKVALSSRLTAIGSLPALRPENFDPGARVAGTPYLEEDFVPARARNVNVTGPAVHLVADGLYAVRYFGIEGRDLSANLAAATAIVNQFAGWKTSLSSGDTLRIRSDVLPTPGQSRRDGDGWFYTPINIFWLVESSLTLS